MLKALEGNKCFSSHWSDWICSHISVISGDFQECWPCLVVFKCQSHIGLQSNVMFYIGYSLIFLIFICIVKHNFSTDLFFQLRVSGRITYFLYLPPDIHQHNIDFILHFQQECHIDDLNKINICIIIHPILCGGVYQPVTQYEPTINEHISFVVFFWCDLKNVRD